jgi:hypothetical protein
MHGDDSRRDCNRLPSGLKGERLKEKIAYDNVLQHLNSGRAEIEYLFEIAEHELKAATEAKLKQRTE